MGGGVCMDALQIAAIHTQLRGQHCSLWFARNTNFMRLLWAIRTYGCHMNRGRDYC
jgi:hypothetical protein